jgi:4-hydroxy-3-methylbut-2-enyl diphosphate reductase
VIGTFGQVPEGRMTLVETAADAEAIQPAGPDSLAFLTQTTLSVDDTAEIVASFAAASPPSRGRAARISATPPPTGRRR